MTPISDHGRPQRTVYVSVPIGPYVWVHKVAQRLNSSGALVFLDELDSLDELQRSSNKAEPNTRLRQVSHRIPSAICYADELLILLQRPTQLGTILNDPFPRRDFLTIALTIAQIRGIPITVFLPHDLSKDKINWESKEVLPFLRDVPDKLEEGKDGSGWEGYYHPSRWNVHLRGGHQNYMRPPHGLRVCLCWVSDTPDTREVKKNRDHLVAELGSYGLVTDLVTLTKKKGKWVYNHRPEEPIDALAICARGDESGLWDYKWLTNLVSEIRKESCPVLFVQRDDADAPVPPKPVEYQNSLFGCSREVTPSEVRALVLGLIGFDKKWLRVSQADEVVDVEVKAPEGTADPAPGRGPSTAGAADPGASGTVPAPNPRRPSRPRTSADIALMTVIPEEYDAVITRLTAGGFPVADYRGTKRRPNLYGWCTADVAGYRVAVAQSALAGNNMMTSAVHATIDLYKPLYVILVGIAGGFAKDGLGKGDVVVAKSIYYYEYGKLGPAYQARPVTYPVDIGLLTSALRLGARAESWAPGVGVTRPDGQPTLPKLRRGPVASGDKLVDNTDNQFFSEVRKVYPDALAVEMEGAGAAAALLNDPQRRRVGFLMVRGISDMPATGSNASPKAKTKPRTTTADDRNQWKEYAAAVAAHFTIYWITQGLPIASKDL